MKQSKKKKKTKTKKTSSWNVRCRSDDVCVVATFPFEDVVILICLDVNLSCSEGDLMKFLILSFGPPNRVSPCHVCPTHILGSGVQLFLHTSISISGEANLGLTTYFRSLATGSSAMDYHIRVRNTVLFTERLTAS
jgi:hypothetical protein